MLLQKKEKSTNFSCSYVSCRTAGHVWKISVNNQVSHQSPWCKLRERSTSCFSNLTEKQKSFPRDFFFKISQSKNDAPNLLQQQEKHLKKLQEHKRGKLTFSSLLLQRLQLLVSPTLCLQTPTIPGCTTCELAPPTLSPGRLLAAYFWKTLSFSVPSTTVKNRWGLEGMKEIRDEGIKLKDGNREARREREGRERDGEREHGERRQVNRLGGENQVMRSKDKSRWRNERTRTGREREQVGM